MRSATDPGEWFLIDFDDASTVPTRAVQHMDRETHSPRVFLDGHRGEVDIWGVGKLITVSAHEAPGVSAAMKALGDRLLSDEPPTAEESIALVRRFTICYFFLLTSIDFILKPTSAVKSLMEISFLYSALWVRASQTYASLRH
jgi:hypothetical protein